MLPVSMHRSMDRLPRYRNPGEGGRTLISARVRRCMFYASKGAGTSGALVSTRVVASLVFGVSAADPVTLVVAATTLVVVALLSSLLPAWRALRLEPAKVLHEK